RSASSAVRWVRPGVDASAAAGLRTVRADALADTERTARALLVAPAAVIDAGLGVDAHGAAQREAAVAGAFAAAAGTARRTLDTAIPAMRWVARQVDARAACARLATGARCATVGAVRARGQLSDPVADASEFTRAQVPTERHGGAAWRCVRVELCPEQR